MVIQYRNRKPGSWICFIEPGVAFALFLAGTTYCRNADSAHILQAETGVPPLAVKQLLNVRANGTVGKLMHYREES